MIKIRQIYQVLSYIRSNSIIWDPKNNLGELDGTIGKGLKKSPIQSKYKPTKKAFLPQIINSLGIAF